MQNVQPPALPGLAYAYCRVSTDHQREGYSLGVQLDQCRQRAAADGYTIPDDGAFVEVFTGTAVRRTVLDAMLAQMLDEDPVSVVIGILHSRHGRIDSDQLEHLLCPRFVPAGRWGKWWSKARTALKRCHNVIVEGKNPIILTHHAEGLTLEDEIEPQ